MESFGIGLRLILLIAGISLAVITVLRMRSGKISLPRWACAVLTISMILLLVVTLIGMLPPSIVTVTNPFVTEDTHIVTPGTSPK